MEVLKIGSLNVDGGRDRERWAVLAELSRNKNIDAFFLQERHSRVDNEVDWGMSWKGQCLFSHGADLSAGVAIVFSLFD